MTLEQIRAALPMHIMLTPNIHTWREGDEIYLEREDVWELIDYPQVVGKHILPGDHNARRPVPTHILDNQAFWLRFEYMQARRLFTGRNTILINRDADDAAFAKGRLYEKWLLEQMEG